MPPAFDSLEATFADRYKLERMLGEGGMATVYLARDLKHDRHVAIKVLKPELAAMIGAERFLAEIKTTANLLHPHILPLHESGEADGLLFYVMPYVEGESLRERLEREHQLPVEEAVAIAKKVAGALQHAHEHGVIHRDIKPANILLQEGEPIVADFGVALAMSSAGSDRLTATGLFVGTPHYMSPEQAVGDHEVGPSSDGYALACVLYEMLAGEPPYSGKTAQAVLGQIVHGAPVSATAARKSVPANVDAAIRKALEKLPADRFTRVQDFARALDEPSFRHGGGEVDLPAPGAISRRRWLAVGGTAVGAFALTASWLVWGRDGTSARSSVIVLMDTPRPEGVYDSVTRAEGGTNADDLTNILRDLPAVIVKENTSPTWNREAEVLLQDPDLVIMHRSAFYGGAPDTWDPIQDKLELFMAYIGHGNPRTRFLIYSRGTWDGDPRVRQQWVESVESRFPVLEGRVTAWQVPLDRPTFRDSTTAAEIRAEVELLIDLP